MLGVVAGLSALGEELVDPTMQMKRAVPFLALGAAVHRLVRHRRDVQGRADRASPSAGPMYAYTYLGVRNVDRKVVEAARGFGLTGAAAGLRGDHARAALPNILMALRICLAISADRPDRRRADRHRPRASATW